MEAEGSPGGKGVNVNTVYHKKQPGTIYDSKERRLFTALVRRRDNDLYRRGMAVRYAFQFAEEGIYMYGYVENDGWDAFRKNMQRMDEKYKAFPRNNGRKIVVSKFGEIKLPWTWKEKVELIDRWIATVPVKMRITGSREFGGRFKGARPRSREPGRYIRLNASIEEIITDLKRDEVKFVEDRENVILNIDPETALEYIEKRKKEEEDARQILAGME